MTATNAQDQALGDMLRHQVLSSLGHEATSEQAAAIATFARFATDRRAGMPVMVLRGSAGTGKTTVAAAIVRAMIALRQRLVLLAPTGRAAKVFALYAETPAYTIHRRIYRQRAAGAWEGSGALFNLNDNLHRDTLFIVDEASMIGSGSEGAFGSGSLLDDLVKYVYADGAGCRMMLIGDAAQLPPVGEEASPALSSDVLRAYGLDVFEATMSEVLRQGQASGILWNATAIRRRVAEADSEGEGMLNLPPAVRFAGFADIVRVGGDELIESLAASYGRVGEDQTVVITRSNRLAVVYNRGIRAQVLGHEEELCRGDQLMIVRNNYHWTSEKEHGIAFLANGDSCVVERVRRHEDIHGFRFAELTLRLPDYDDLELTVTALLDTLAAEAPALTREQQTALYERAMEDYADLPTKSDRMKALREDRFYNALQLKYGYAVTCHKAQGGQWAHVYIDQGYVADTATTADYCHWLYTAITRATEKVFLVNWPEDQTDNSGQ